MQSLSVSNLQVFEIEDNGYTSGTEHQKSFKNSIKTTDNSNNILNKFNLKLSLGKLLPKNNQKCSVNLNDSGYISGSTSAETIFSIDNNNYVSFKRNPDLRRELYCSSQSLYDKSPIDLTEIFGLSFKTISELKSNNQNVNKDSKNYSNIQQKNSREYVNKSPEIKYENRSWDQITRLSDVCIQDWVSAKRSQTKSLAFNRRKTFEYFEPNFEAKNSLLLNHNLLFQPIRRYTSEINVRKLVFNSSEMFSDDFQLDSHMILDNDLIEKSVNISLDQRSEVSSDDPLIENNYTEEIYDLFMDLHEFRINDDNIEKVAENICKIDKYLLSRVRAGDVAGYLFSKSKCGCGLSSICSVIQFSQALIKIVVNCIDSKIAAYQRIAYMIAFIKVSSIFFQFQLKSKVEN